MFTVKLNVTLPIPSISLNTTLHSLLMCRIKKKCILIYVTHIYEHTKFQNSCTIIPQGWLDAKSYVSTTHQIIICWLGAEARVSRGEQVEYERAHTTVSFIASIHLMLSIILRASMLRRQSMSEWWRGTRAVIFDKIYFTMLACIEIDLMPIYVERHVSVTAIKIQPKETIYGITRTPPQMLVFRKLIQQTSVFKRARY